MSGIIIDIGTGDGKFVHSLAKEYPDRYIIGIDPHQDGLKEISTKIDKKPSKGGVHNALFVLADVENLPEELNGLANQVFINFPWSSLLKGVVLGEDKTWNSIRRICQEGAYIDIIFGYDKSLEEGKVETLGLHKLNLEYIQEVWAPKLLFKGVKMVEARGVNIEELKDFPSSWSKKLRFGKDREYYYCRLQVN